MKKQDLRTGDIVVTRDGSEGIVIAEKKVIIYPESGMDFYDDLTENLLLVEDYRGGDIMAVYRDGYGEVICFTDYKDCDPIFEREDDIIWTEDMHWKNRQKKECENPIVEKPERKSFYGMIQAFYGNRTCIEFTEDSVDGLIAGCPDRSLYHLNQLDRSILHLPGEDGLVLLYNRYQEEESLQEREEAFCKDGYVMKPLAVIPEMNIELYSRCLACRMDAEGKLGGLEEKDYETVLMYLAE